MTPFAYETDTPTVEAAISQAADTLGVADAAAIWANPKTVLMMDDLPKEGQEDNVRGHLTDAYLFASSNRYEVPSDEAVGRTGWHVTLREGDGGTDASTGAFCVVIDCGTPSWQVTSYRKVPRTKATAKFHLRFVVEADGEVLADFEKVSEAKEFAKGMCSDPSSIGLDEAPGEVSIRRRPVSDGNSDLATMYKRHSRTSKSRPAKVPEGATVTATHHWLVYGKVPTGGNDALRRALAGTKWDKGRSDAIVP